MFFFREGLNDQKGSEKFANVGCFNSYTLLKSELSYPSLFSFSLFLLRHPSLKTERDSEGFLQPLASLFLLFPSLSFSPLPPVATLPPHLFPPPLSMRTVVWSIPQHDLKEWENTFRIWSGNGN